MEMTTSFDGGRRCRQRSDELIDDLEAELGNSQVSYMTIDVSYRHSAFPEYSGPEVLAGVSYLQSQMKTVATASLKQNNFLSCWSPRPASNMNGLIELIKTHWGTERSAGIIRQIKLTQPVAKRLVKSQSKPILRQPNTLAMTHAHRRRQSAQGFTITCPDPAVLKKSAPRKTSARSISRSFRSRRDTSATTSGAESTTALQRDGEAVAAGKRKSLGTEILRSLTPSLATIYSSPREVERGSKDSAFWGWGSWF